MKRLLIPLVVFALVAGALSAGALTWNSGAAKVNGATISVAQLNRTLGDASSSSSFRCLLAQQGAIAGAGEQSTYSSRFAASELSLLIQRAELRAEVQKLGLRPTSLARQVAQSQLTAGLSSQQGSSCIATGAQVISSLPASYADLLTELQLNQDLIAAHLAGASLTPVGVQAYASAHPDVAKLACVSVILLPSKSAATSALAALHSGQSFSSVAKAKSIDPQTAKVGGAIGCVYPGQFAAGLSHIVATANVGVPQGPIQFSSDYVLLEVTARKQGSSSGAAYAVVASALNSELVFMRHVAASDHVWVNTAYGNWTLSSGAYRVVAPNGPMNAVVLNPTAVTPVGDAYQ